MREVTGAEPPPAQRHHRRPLRATLVAWVSIGLIATGLAHSTAYAQVPRGGQILPPLPTPPPPELELLPRERVLVREVRVIGSMVFSVEELAKVTAPYLNRELTTENLEALRVALTLLYVNAGYVNSGAILPDQRVVEGVITYQIIEGAVTAIEVAGNRWFRSSYLQKRLALGAGPPVNAKVLQEQIQLLLEDPRIRRLHVELLPGLNPGDAVLKAAVEDRPPFRASIEFNNYLSPSVGAEQGLLTLEDVNLTGNGDILTLRYGGSEGAFPLYDFRYSLPFTARDTTLSLRYQKNTFAVLEEPFQELDIETESEIYTIAVRQPVFRTLNSEVAITLIGEHLSHETFLLGERFTLVPGARDGKSVVTALRALLEWVYRTPDQVIALRSRFSAGLNILGATINPNGEPDGKFFAWLGQAQLVRRLPFLDAQLILRTDFQLANDRLLSLEQVAVGGRYTVRGYRENTFVRDNAFVASLEARVPLFRNTPWADFLELAPFADYGRSWRARSPPPDAEVISSAGIGLRWAVTIAAGPISLRPQLEVYWGHPWRDLKTAGNDLQDKGVHLQFVLSAFF